MLKLAFTLAVVLFTSACSQQIYQGKGQYQDSDGIDRGILLQWKAQTYYLPFLTNDVDYGSVSLQTECTAGSLLDFENHAQYGLVFKERPQQFKLVDNAPRIKLGNFIVCAKLKDNANLAQLNVGDTATLETFCQAKAAESAIIAANLEGYNLTINTSEVEDTINCK